MSDVTALIVRYNAANPQAPLVIQTTLAGGPPNGLPDYGTTPNVVLLSAGTPAT